MEEMLIIEAMKKAVSRNIRNWDYAAAILKDCLNKNIKTLEQYEASQLEFKNKKSKDTATDEKTEEEKKLEKIKKLEESQRNANF